MPLYTHNHLDEFNRSIRTPSGWKTAAERKALALTALGVTPTAAVLTLLDGMTIDMGDVTALAREVNELDQSAKFTFFEDFYGTWAIGDAGPADRFASTAGSGAGTQVATTVAGSLNGAVTLKSSTADDTHAANNSIVSTINLGFQADSGGLAIEARVQLDAITDVYLFVGFTDALGSTVVECPIFMNAADLDSDADNACGVIFDTDATSDFFTVGGVKATVDVTPVVSAVAPVAGTYAVIRAEVSAAGTVTGYINGTSIGSVANAVTVTTPLTGAIVVGNRGAAQRIATIDYIKVEQNRVD